MKYTDGYHTFNSYEEAFEDCQQSMTWDDYAKYFEKIYGGFLRFFYRISDKLPGFVEEFEEELFEAEVDYFEKNYSEINDEDEEEEG